MGPASSAVLDVVRLYIQAGLSCIPITTSGKKDPAVRWEEFQSKPATESQWQFWLEQETCGIGIVGGAVSGNLFVLDFEYADIYEEWAELVRLDYPDLLPTLPHVQTPGKSTDVPGVHVFIRREDRPQAGGVLARLPWVEAIQRTGDRKHTVAIEIRGKGNYVVAPGSPAECHTSKRLYVLQEGSVAIEAVPVVGGSVCDTLIDLARSLNRDDRIRVETGHLPGRPPANGERPGDAYCRSVSWPDVLEPHGWTLVRDFGQKCQWRRPGKTEGISATTGHCQGKSGDLFYVFSTNADPFEAGKSYTKFAAHAVLEHGGDYKIAARELGKQGYGDPPTKQQVSVYIEEDERVGEPGPEEPDEPLHDATEISTPDEFPLESLPPALRDFVVAVAQSVGCAVDYPAVSLLALASAAIGSSRACGVSRTWVECPRLFVAFIGPPGSGKTPSIQIMDKPIRERQNQLVMRWREQREAYEQALAEYEDIRKSKGKRQDTTEAVKPVEPSLTHLYTDDATTEELKNILARNPRGIIQIMDEISGWVASMNQYKAGGKGNDKQFWLSLWSGTTCKTDRKGQGTSIAHNPFVSLLGGVQPDMLSSLVDQEGRDDGFLHRILFVKPKELPWSPTIGDSPPEHLENAWRCILDELYSWEMIPNQDGTFRPYIWKFTEKAWGVACDWYKDHAEQRNEADFRPNLVGPWSKLKAYFFRLIVVVHALRLASGVTASKEIEAESVCDAATIADYFKSHLQSVYRNLNATKEDRRVLRILEWIRERGGKVTVRDLVRSDLAKKMSDGEALLKDLADRGYGTLQRTREGPTPGRHKIEFRLSANLLNSSPTASK